MDIRRRTGRIGEERAAAFLKKRGYRILARNFSNKLGEIDIVALENGVVCFVEVRARSGPQARLRALESVDGRKQFRLSRLALSFLKEKRLLGRSARFDVVCVVGPRDEDLVLVKDAFELCQSQV